MSRSPWTEEKIARYVKEGRGEGHGASYKPFIEVSDISSRGLSRRVFGHKSGRVHHFLSNVEHQFFLMLEWNTEIIDIREQYPLPRNVTTAIASKHRLSHPFYPGTKIPTVMTIDVLATRLVGGEEVFEAYDIKRTEEAKDFRSVEKLEITRASCEALSIPHRIVFHSMLPEKKIQNIEWILGARPSPNETDAERLVSENSGRLLQFLMREPKERTLLQCCEAYDISLGLPAGSALRCARVLMSQRALSPNLAIPDLVMAPLSEFQFFAQPGQLRAVGG